MSLTGREQAKYEKMWGYDQYRHNAPGEKCVYQAIDTLGMVPGDTVIDFGCGTGRPALALQDAGMVVTAVDFASNCMDGEPRAKVAFFNACLWDMPASLRAKWGFCTDVMEHIPSERVDDVLQSIREATIHGAFFQIATRPDRMGRLIGEPLHLTVRDADWWRDKLKQHWSSAQVNAAQGSVLVAVWP